MKKLAALFTALLVSSQALAAAPGVRTDCEWNPPARFAGKYKGRLSIEYIDTEAQLISVCKQFKRPGKQLNGCSYWTGDRSQCWVFVIRVAPTDCPNAEAILRHEIGHCNGWSKFHGR